MWKKIDAVTQATIPNLTQNDQCWYARDFLRHRGFAGGETNSLILNFKKVPNTAGWNHRTNAVRKFADEASLLISVDREASLCVTAIPSSKARNHAQYDHRFEDMFAQLKTLRPCIDIQWPITCQTTTIASHQGGTRLPQGISSNYVWNGFTHTIPESILIFDDVLTSGAHYRAFVDFLRTNGFTGEIFGIFWAKSD